MKYLVAIALIILGISAICCGPLLEKKNYGRKISGTCPQCASGLNCCVSEANGAQCFDESVQTCWGGVLCANGLKACSKACYNPQDKKCENGQLRDREDGEDTDGEQEAGACAVNSCGEGLSCCPTQTGESQCYRTSEYQCFGNLLCTVGFQRCGGACYNPATYQCVNNQLVLA